MLFLFCFAFCYFSLLSNICKQQSKYEIRRSILLGPGELFLFRSTMDCFIMHCFWSSVFINTKINNRSSYWRCFTLKGVLKTFTDSQQNTCVNVSACNFIIKETLAQGFSYKFCKILKDIFFTEHYLATACAISF